MPDLTSYTWLLGPLIFTILVPAWRTSHKTSLAMRENEAELKDQQGQIIKAQHEMMRAQEEQRKDQLALIKADKQMLHDRIFNEGARYLHQGYVSLDELDNFQRLCDCYFALGGNGTGHAMHEKVVALPNREPDYTLEKYGKN